MVYIYREIDIKVFSHSHDPHALRHSLYFSLYIQSQHPHIKCINLSTSNISNTSHTVFKHCEASVNHQKC